MSNVLSFPPATLQLQSRKINTSMDLRSSIHSVVQSRKIAKTLDSIIIESPVVLDMLMAMSEWLSPILPGDQHESLLGEVVKSSVEAYISHSGLTYEGRIRSFISGMVYPTSQMLLHRVYIQTNQSNYLCWNRFSEPLTPWLKKNHAKELFIERDFSIKHISDSSCRQIMACKTVPENLLHLI